MDRCREQSPPLEQPGPATGRVAACWLQDGSAPPPAELARPEPARGGPGRSPASPAATSPATPAAASPATPAAPSLAEAAPLTPSIAAPDPGSQP
jgi:hypothetical protein